MTKEQAIRELTEMPGIGKSLATDPWNIGMTSVADLKGKSSEVLKEKLHTAGPERPSLSISIHSASAL